ncbi:MAG: DUF1553 domain-containing protein [Chitinophagaceae bacterium]
MINRILLFSILSILLISCSPDLPDDVAIAYKNLPDKIDFNQDVKPILSDRCFSCHGPDKGKQKAGLRLDLEKSAFGELPESPGKWAIVPGNLRKSELFKRIISTDPKFLMPEPKSHLTLSANEKAILIKWVNDGAKYKPHWAFIKPEKPELPSVTEKILLKTPIDNFIESRLEKQRLTLSPEADKETLLRRLSLDLTGLPPGLNEIDLFLKDASPKAYEIQVDRLLASPHYGEKMAVDWLDVARFADSHGYTVDRLRDMSPWRDWVVKAFNQNLHYNDFITWQLAGDLLPNPTREQLIATAFNRNHQQNMEGGIVEEEFRVEYVSDRTNTTGEAFMGLTIGCAKCHDHKFDPISQKEYYQLTSFFNNVKEAGQISWDNAMPVPTLLLTDSAKEKIVAMMKQKENQQVSALTKLTQGEENNFQQWLQTAMYKKYSSQVFPNDMVAHFPLNNLSLKNILNARDTAIMMREGNVKEKPVFIKSERNNSLLFDGDIWLNLNKVGRFKRSEPFSVGVWLNVPKALTTGVIFHRGTSGLLYNFRGFHLNIKDNRLELEMAHTAPYNAIIEYTKKDIPRDQWIQLTVTYDGSSSASGYKIYLNGEEMETTIDQDKLYKDIVFYDNNPPGLQFGAWERGKGLAGGKANDITVFNRELSSLEIIQLYNAKTFAGILSKQPDNLLPAEKVLLKSYYFANFSASAKTLLDTLKRIRSIENDSIEKVPELMIMQEMNHRRPAYVLDRGLYDAHKEEVSPDVPSRILPMPKNLPRNRLGLAQWLTSAEHPLTARVTVNRYWQMLFGRGLVNTSEDFGNQGEMPSHPELLDWLAINFRESGWDVKALMKQMVMSATYRQSSKTNNHLQSIDPENILLARGPANRLTGEMLRDNALAASGLLNDKIGGPSVFPYQPEGLWKINGAVYTPDSTDHVYRRGMYTIWKRSVPNPTQSTFDVGIRTSCIVRRQITNTPLQALITLNDPTFVEAAKVMGEEMTKAPNIKTAITDAFRKLTGRTCTSKELQLLTELEAKEYQKFKSNIAKAKGWLNTGLRKTDPTLPQDRLAANTVVASTIMNADATITKR